MLNALTIDIEDYFQVSAFEEVSPPEGWGRCECRVARNTDRVLDILDDFEVKATFFVLGWVARRCPEVVRRIAAEGHEVASHGDAHRRVPTQRRLEFREDVRRSKALLEDLSGQEVWGYRAPSYSIGLQTLWAFDELIEAGYRYDSSVFPARHDFYGLPDWPRFPFCLLRHGDGDWAPAASPGDGPGLTEIPVSTLRLAGHNVPIAGGGYFRLYPYRITRWGLMRLNQREGRPFVFYIHPWEFDPGQPRMAGARWKSRFRHYLNLGKTEVRFKRLLGDFRFAPIADTLTSEFSYAREVRADSLDVRRSQRGFRAEYL